MKKSLPSLLLSFLFLTFLFTNQNSLAQGWEWSKSSGGLGNDGAMATATDRAGNVVVTGNFQNGGDEFFLTKYDGSGAALCTKFVLGPGNEIGNDVDVDSSGNIYVTGNFSSPTIIFGTDTLRNTGDKDIFIVKYDPNGNVVWARSAVGTANTDEESNGIVVDIHGDILISGEFGYDSLAF